MLLDPKVECRNRARFTEKVVLVVMATGSTGELSLPTEIPPCRVTKIHTFNLNMANKCLL